tara:strand:- start:299 stop:838 length:540 start_codon:yes stop_codon:yes gene_type:complete
MRKIGIYILLPVAFFCIATMLLLIYKKGHGHEMLETHIEWKEPILKRVSFIQVKYDDSLPPKAYKSKSKNSECFDFPEITSTNQLAVLWFFSIFEFKPSDESRDNGRIPLSKYETIYGYKIISYRDLIQFHPIDCDAFNDIVWCDSLPAEIDNSPVICQQLLASLSNLNISNEDFNFKD